MRTISRSVYDDDDDDDNDDGDDDEGSKFEYPINNVPRW